MNTKTLFRTLKHQARESSAWRGHTMKRFSTTIQLDRVLPDRYSGIATCAFCGAYVQVTTHPQPNGISIGGSAVAINCTAR